MLRQWILRIKDASAGWTSPHGKNSFLTQLPPKAHLLDVGPSSGLAQLPKLILPSCTYTGIDVVDYNQGASSEVDSYIVTSPENFALEIEKLKGRFDAVISAHNLEHCDDRNRTLDAMAAALRPGGKIYLSFPSAASAAYPKRGGSLNYYDDPTHKGTPPDFDSVLGVLRQRGFEIVFAVRRYRPWAEWIIGFFNEWRSRKRNKVGWGTWGYYGFESVIWAKKR